MTGFGLTPQDEKAGIKTIEDKLDNMCPHYSAMNNLMGHRAFVTPWYKADAQDDQDTSDSSGSEINEERGSEVESEILAHSMVMRDGLGVSSALSYCFN